MKLLERYFNNGYLTSKDIYQLYEIVGDPWFQKSEENYLSMSKYINKIHDSLNLNNYDVFVDFGCGLGVIGNILKSKFPDLFIVGIDYDIAFKRESNEYNLEMPLLYDETENDILNRNFPDWKDKKVIIHGLNSFYYLFNDSYLPNQDFKAFFEKLSGGSEEGALISSTSGRSWSPPGIDKTSVKEINFISTLDNPYNLFKTELFTSIWY